MGNYQRGQRVRITAPTLDDEQHLVGTEGRITTASENRHGDVRYAVRLAGIEGAIRFYADEFEPIDPILAAPNEGDTVTINGTTYALDEDQHGWNVRVDSDTTVAWQTLQMLGFTADQATPEQTGAGGSPRD